jgi:hypothetical protein
VVLKPLHPIYYVINRKLIQVESFVSATDVAVYMLGKRMDLYVIVKSTWDADGHCQDRLVNSPSSDIKHLELQLELV